MSEAAPNYLEQNFAAYDSFVNIVRGEVENPPGKDQMLADMWRAYLQVSEQRPELKDTVAETVSLPNFSQLLAPQQTGRARTSFQADFLGHERGSGFGRIRWSVSNYVEAFNNLADSSERLMWLGIYLNRAVQTNIPARAVMPDLFSQVAAAELGREVRILSMGCGILLVEKQLLLKNQPGLGFKPVEVRSKPRLANKINIGLLKRKSTIERIVASDLQNPDDPSIRIWARAAFRPGEMLDSSFSGRVNALDEAELPKELLDYDHRDLTDSQDRALLEPRFGSKRPDIALCSTVFNQINEDERDSALQYFKDLGVRWVVVQDFARPSGHHNHDLRFYKKWHDKAELDTNEKPSYKFKYRLSVWDHEHEALGWQEFARSAPDSRCEIIAPGLMGRLVVGNERRSPANILLEI